MPFTPLLATLAVSASLLSGLDAASAADQVPVRAMQTTIAQVLAGDFTALAWQSTNGEVTRTLTYTKRGHVLRATSQSPGSPRVRIVINDGTQACARTATGTRDADAAADRRATWSCQAAAWNPGVFLARTFTPVGFIDSQRDQSWAAGTPATFHINAQEPEAVSVTVSTGGQPALTRTFARNTTNGASFTQPGLGVNLIGPGARVPVRFVTSPAAVRHTTPADDTIWAPPLAR